MKQTYIKRFEITGVLKCTAESVEEAERLFGLLSLEDIAEEGRDNLYCDPAVTEEAYDRKIQAVE